MEKELLVPYAPILVESTRSIGYSFEAAIADIIDNSISASAKDIQICFSSLEPQWLYIADNGWGMTKSELITAMRYGSQSSHDIRRKEDLGRFGLGLKLASLSQCRKVTVMTKKEGIFSAACWDLDFIIQQKDWALQLFSESEMSETRGYIYLKSKSSGTVVLWEHFDRLQQGPSEVRKAFDEKIDIARRHISLVFHRFLSDELINNRISISFNGEVVKGVDPFLSKHPATQPLSEQVLRIDAEEIRVKPYVLPYISKMSVQDIDEIGGIDELRQKQGFYIYRNRRLILWGTWFRLIKQNELGKLARVRVDIPNSLDSIWEIDIKKSTASLPFSIRKKLADIVKNTVGRSERVYRYRGRNVQTDKLIHVWDVIDDRGQIQYVINRNLPIVKLLEASLDENGIGVLEVFISMLENAFPYSDVYYRMANSEIGDSGNTLESEVVYMMAAQLIQQLIATGGNVAEFLNGIDKIDYFAKYPDVVSQIREVYNNE